MDTTKGGYHSHTPAGKVSTIVALEEHRCPPGEAHLTHGATRMLSTGLAPPCRLCVARDGCENFDAEAVGCVIVEAEQTRLVASVAALPHITETDLPAVREWALLSVTCTVIDRYVGHRGMFSETKGGLDVQPVLRFRLTLSNRVSSLADALALTPAARAKLRTGEGGTPGDKLAAAFATLAREEREAANREAVDADFTDEAGDGDDRDAGDTGGAVGQTPAFG